jgi:enamine deaminase RidA (YjgF/YER057c/UK114 family)
LEGGVKPIAPFSIGTVVSSRANLVYLSGTIGVDPKVEASSDLDIRASIW